MPSNRSSVKTLLITDLVDSTGLVERLGNARATEVFASVDRCARDLLMVHGGREIDKTDGFLMLFEQPRNAVAFALDFFRGLEEIGIRFAIKLESRAGIHQGEVYLRENSPEDVRRGAKALEVEGLAKPIAARLMSAARGSQILVSEAASFAAGIEPDGELERRVEQSREPRSEALGRLEWKSHGNYFLKGVAEPMGIFEVSRPGTSGFRPPLRSDKVRRARKSGSLVTASLATVAFSVMIVVGYFMLGSKETFAFARSDWVVIGPFANHTDETLLSDSLDTAFRVALEQSRYASVVPYSEMRRALQRMKKDPGSLIDRHTGIELTKREQARAYVTGGIREVGRGFQINAQVIDPRNGKTVLIASAKADSMDGILTAMDDVTRELRGKLGESLDSIEENSMPLAQVTTADFEALRAYSLAQTTIAEGRLDEAMLLLDRAIQLDPAFAMAHARIAQMNFSYESNRGESAHHWQLALAHSQRLTRREKLYVEASSAWLKTPGEMLRGWKLMSSLYPDQSVGHHNIGYVNWRFFNRCEPAIPAFKKAYSVKHPWNYVSYHHKGYCHLMLEDLDAAIKDFRISYGMNDNPLDFGIVDAYVAARRYSDAEAVLARAAQIPSPKLRFEAAMRHINLYADKGQLEEGIRLARQYSEARGDDTNPDQRSRGLAALVALRELQGSEKELRGALENAIAFEYQRMAEPQDNFPRPYQLRLAILAKVAARNKLDDIAARTRERIGQMLAQSDYPIWRAHALLLEADEALGNGVHTQAIERAESSLALANVFQGHETLARAYRAAGNKDQAAKHLRWMLEHRGAAFGEQHGHRSTIAPFNIIDAKRARLQLARLEASRGNRQAASAHYRDFLREWAGERNALPVRVAQRELAATSEPFQSAAALD